MIHASTTLSKQTKNNIKTKQNKRFAPSSSKEPNIYKQRSPPVISFKEDVFPRPMYQMFPH